MATAHDLSAGSTARASWIRVFMASVFVFVGPATFSPAFATPGPAASALESPQSQHVWTDVNGDPLPFRNDEEVQDFLRTADVVDREELPVGVTDPIRVTLEKDGVRAYAVFRYLDTVYDSVRMEDGRVRSNLKDSCHFEAAAYELAKLLGVDNVPPVVTRRIGTDSGTLQMWVSDAMMESEREEKGIAAPNRLAWNRQVQAMYIFDAVIGNDDRTLQNILIDKSFKMWLIDHTRAFYRRAEASFLDKVIYVERGFWDRLQALDKEQLNETVGEYLSGAEIDQLLERRDHVVAYVQGLIDARTEGAVLYDGGPSGG